MTPVRSGGGWRPSTIGILGVGGVGTCLAAEIFFARSCGTLLLHNRSSGRREELAAELAACGATESGTDSPDVHAVGDLEPLMGVDLLLVCVKSRYRVKLSGVTDARARLVGLRDVPLIARIARRMRGFRGLVMMITNPVELMCAVWGEHAGRPERVVGMGLSLDAARSAAMIRRLGARDEPRLVALGTHALGPFLSRGASVVGGQPLDHALEELDTTPEAVLAGCARSVMDRIRRYGRTTFEPARVFRRDLDTLARGDPINASWAGCGSESGRGHATPVGGLLRIDGCGVRALPLPPDDRDRLDQRAAVRTVMEHVERLSAVRGRKAGLASVPEQAAPRPGPMAR